MNRLDDLHGELLLAEVVSRLDNDRDEVPPLGRPYGRRLAELLLARRPVEAKCFIWIQRSS